MATVDLMTGNDFFVGFGKEATYGTFVAGKVNSYIQNMTSESLQLKWPVNFHEYMSGSRNRLTPYRGGKQVTGDIKVAQSYEGCEWLYDALTGGTHTYSIAGGTYQALWGFTPGSVPIGLSISMNKDLYLFQYAGCHVTGAEFNFPNVATGENTFNIVGASETAAAIETGKTYRTFVPILYTQREITFGATPATIKTYTTAATVKVENPMGTGLYGFTSATQIQPAASGNQKISGSITYLLESTMKTGIYDVYAAGTEVEIHITCTGGTIPSSTPAATYLFQIDLPSCQLGEAGSPTGSAGTKVVEVTQPFEAFYDGTNAAMTLTVRNGNTTDIA